MNALVTGGSKGIGLAVVKALQAEGHKVAVVARSKQTVDCDLYLRRNLIDNYFFAPGIVEQTINALGGLDILVNNAGSQYNEKAITFQHFHWDRQLLLMLTVPFMLSQAAAQYMTEHGGGRIINMSSVAGVIGTRGVVAYSVAKAGLIEMTKCLSNEWLPFGITVNAIAPGFIETGMQTLTPEHKQAMLGRIPAGRFGTTEEVASAVMWLISDAARYVSGICLPVDGGWLAR